MDSGCGEVVLEFQNDLQTQSKGEREGSIFSGWLAIAAGAEARGGHENKF